MAMLQKKKAAVEQSATGPMESAATVPTWIHPKSAPALIGKATALQAQLTEAQTDLTTVEAKIEALRHANADPLLSRDRSVLAGDLFKKQLASLNKLTVVYRAIVALGPELDADSQAFDKAIAEITRRMVSVGFPDAAPGMAGYSPYFRAAALVHPEVVAARQRTEGVSARPIIPSDLSHFAVQALAQCQGQAEQIRRKLELAQAA